jgi:hypothetical protein
MKQDQFRLDHDGSSAGESRKQRTDRLPSPEYVAWPDRPKSLL